VNDEFDNPLPNKDNQKYNVGPDDVVIRRKDLEPLNDPNCEHALEPDDDEIGDSRAWICSKCQRGVFLPKTVKSII
jgi:hypothetical protein